jgi:hypothetical protein
VVCLTASSASRVPQALSLPAPPVGLERVREKQSVESKGKMELHDVCASRDHVVALFESIPQAGEKPLFDRLIYVAHVNDDGKITRSSTRRPEMPLLRATQSSFRTSARSNCGRPAAGGKPRN